MAEKKTKRSYGQNKAELEEIVSQIEAGELGIDQLQEKVARAGELLKLCRETLFKTNKDVEKLLEGIEKDIDQGDEGNENS